MLYSFKTPNSALEDVCQCHQYLREESLCTVLAELNQTASLMSKKMVGLSLQEREVLLQLLIGVGLLVVSQGRMVSHEDGLSWKLGNFSIVLEIKIQIINVKKRIP